MIPITIEDAEKLYQQFCADWAANLEQLGVIKPPEWGTSASMLFTYAYANIGRPFKGNDAVDWCNRLGCAVRDPQILRHMSNGYGYNARGRSGLLPNGTKVKMGEYALVNMTEIAPGWKGHRQNLLQKGDWTDIKAAYNYRCVCCGSREGQANHRKPGTMTVLEQGHMDPKKPLGPGNIIPQCQICNKPYRDNVVFTSEGYVWALGNTVLVERSSEDVQLEILQYLLKNPKLADVAQKQLAKD
jgi:hypothetical protein